MARAVLAHVHDWFSERDAAGDIIEAVRSDDPQRLERAVDRWMAAMVGSMHSGLFGQALAQSLRALGWRGREVGPIWPTEDALNDLGGRCVVTHLRPVLWEGVWGEMIREAEDNLGSNSPFVIRMRDAARPNPESRQVGWPAE